MPFKSSTVTLDTGVVNSVSTNININSEACLAWEVKANTGTPDGAVIVLEVSLDNNNFHPFFVLRESDKIGHLASIGFGYVRFSTEVASSVASTVSIILNAK